MRLELLPHGRKVGALDLGPSTDSLPRRGGALLDGLSADAESCGHSAVVGLVDLVQEQTRSLVLCCVDEVGQGSVSVQAVQLLSGEQLHSQRYELLHSISGNGSKSAPTLVYLAPLCNPS